ncbi:MAG: MaoC family dehydratase [Halanaerobiales bacterium]
MQGKSIEELQVGEKASMTKTITEADVVNYAGVTGDFNPAHINESYAKNTIFKGRIAHGMLSAGLISAVLGTKLPGPGSIYVSQDLQFKAPVRINDTITAEVSVGQKDENKNRVTMETICTNQDGKEVVTGKAVLMPVKK